MNARPAQKTLETLRKHLIRAGVVERFLPAGQGRPFGNRRDLFGIIDIIALTPSGVLGIQVCGTDWSSHIHKLRETECDESLREWLATPGTRFQMWGWRKLKVKRGGKAMRWTPRIQTWKKNGRDLLVTPEESPGKALF